MVFGGVGSGYQDNVRGFDIGNGVCHGAGSECCGQTGHGGAVSETGAMIDVVGFEHRPHELLDHIIVFVGHPGGGEYADAVRAMGRLDSAKLIRHLVQGLIPGCFPKLAVFLDKRCGQSSRDR